MSKFQSSVSSRCSCNTPDVHRNYQLLHNFYEALLAFTVIQKDEKHSIEGIPAPEVDDGPSPLITLLYQLRSDQVFSDFIDDVGHAVLDQMWKGEEPQERARRDSLAEMPPASFYIVPIDPMDHTRYLILTGRDSTRRTQ